MNAGALRPVAARLVPGPWKLAVRARDRSRLLDALPRGVRRDGLVVLQHLREGRFQRSLAFVTAGSMLLAGFEVAYEHYRGSYGQRKMYTPVAMAPVLIGASLWAVFDRRAVRWALPVASLLTMADGLWGFTYHVRGVARKPGGWRIPVFNVIMGPPIFAPLLFAVPGYLGLVASLLRREDDPSGRFLPGFLSRRRRPLWLSFLPHRLTREGLTLWGEAREGKFQKHMAGAAAAASVFNGVEALYSHYKNRFKYRVEWTPIVSSALLAAAGIGAVFSRRAAHRVLPAVSALAVVNGLAGVFFHGRGIKRRPGGFTVPIPSDTRRAGGLSVTLQNVMYGPPIFAPLLLGAAGFMGLLASLLRRER